jgi:hypothetical protein
MLLPVVAVLGAAAAAASQPTLVLGAALAMCVAVLAFRLPVANLAVLIFLTAVVPYGILNTHGGGGVNSPGLIISDPFLLAGLAWAVLTFPSLQVDRRSYLYGIGMIIFLGLVVVQFIHGLRSGTSPSIIGQEGRVLLGCGTFLIALPLLAHAPSRQRLLVALVAISLLLGSWGLLQWFGHYSFGAAGDVGVRAGVRLTTGGSGQLQGGEFDYPVAVVMCFAALALGELRSWPLRIALFAGLALNAACCLVTFERTFWLDAIAGIAIVAIMARGRRPRVLVTLVTSAAIAIGILSAISPQTLTTAGQRLLSIGAYASDASVRYRVVESQFVYAQIRAHPVDGSGLGATIFWGQPWAQVPPKAQHYSHDGYLWLAWKLGIPAAAILLVMLVGSIFGRSLPDEEPLSRALRLGARGAIVGLLLASITFPSFSQLSVVPVIGLMLAIAVSPLRRRPRAAPLEALVGDPHASASAALSAR